VSKISIKINGQTVHGNNRELLLTQMENAGLNPEFQCRDGVCGFCRCKLIEGEVKQHASLAMVENDEILACCSVPTSDIEVQFSYELEQSKVKHKKLLTEQ